MLSLVSAGALAFLLLVALTACQINAQQTTPPLPQLLDVIRVAGPKDIAIAPNGWAYIISDGGSDGIVSIVVLDGSKIIGRIPWPDNHLPTGEVAQLAIHPITGLVYVIDPWAKLIYVIDKLEVVAVIDTLYALGRIAIHPTSGLVYVTNYTNRPQPGVAPGPGDVAVISGTEVITRITMQRPTTIGVNPFDGRVYVSQQIAFWPDDQALVTELLMVIDGEKLLPGAFAPKNGGGDIYDIVANRQNGEMYFTRGNYGLIAYWDRQVLHPIDVGGAGYSINTIALDARRNWLYAASWDGPPSHVLVIEKDKILAALPVGEDVRDVAVDETHDYVYAANYRSNNLSIIRGTEVITTVATGGLGPWQIAVDEPRGYIYVTNSNSASVAVFGFAEEIGTPSLWQRFLPFIQR